LPRSERVRELQAELVARYRLRSAVFGRGSDQRLRVFPSWSGPGGPGCGPWAAGELTKDRPLWVTIWAPTISEAPARGP